MREPISPEEKLAITLRFIATGESYESLMYLFHVHSSTIGKFIPEVCFHIYHCLKDQFLSLPRTSNEWEKYAEETEKRWQFPNCIGAADGKHIAILHPAKSGADFFNYKGFFSIDVGCQGRISDGGVYRNSYFYKAIEQDKINLPKPRSLPSSNDPVYIDQSSEEVPFVFVADEAFPLGLHCMKPFKQHGLTPRKRIFNYRLSRVRRISENAFGIWVNRFRVFTTKMSLDPDKATIITLSSLVLHNLLREMSRETYTPEEYVDEELGDGSIKNGLWREENIDGGEVVTTSIPSSTSDCANYSAEYVREIFADHFWGPGQISWQWKMI